MNTANLIGSLRFITLSWLLLATKSPVTDTSSNELPLLPVLQKSVRKHGRKTTPILWVVWMVELIDTGLRQPKDEAEWLAWRRQGIGASEASAVVGRNPYLNNQALWRYKTGQSEPEDISGKACVQYGHDAEAPIRELFALDHPEFTVQYGGDFDMVRHPHHPWLFATLDGRLIERSTGKRGIYEGKTTEILRSMQMEKWTYTDDDGHRRGRVPDNYYVQLLHQLLATGWDFAVLNCRFKRFYRDGMRAETRCYRFDREDVQDDLDYLLDAEKEFWRSVQDGTMPPLILPVIG